MRKSSETALASYSGFYYMLKHPFKEDFDKMILRMQASGTARV